jgi:phosphopantothenoylcysteine decarboxylase/phosphopantothenate--cysteine ligase
MRILITAGPTREPIDTVRFISNRSSGRLGLALAHAAVAAGHQATLLLGPGPQVDPDDPALRGYGGSGCNVHRFESAAELQQLLETHFRGHDVLIMAAAVCDYRPATVVDGKIPREHPGAGAGKPLTLTLEPTPDLVALMAASKRSGQRIVAFALEEPAHLEARATEKLRRKGVDAIVANPLSTMESDRITPTWLTAAGKRVAPGTMSKDDFAKWLIDLLSRDGAR